jgi:hypothetical protein
MCGVSVKKKGPAVETDPAIMAADYRSRHRKKVLRIAEKESRKQLRPTYLIR